MNGPLSKHLPLLEVNESSILSGFLNYIKETSLDLYPAQEEAIMELYSGKNVILNTPTGSGKSLVATALHFNALARKKRSIYTSPIKALVNEKFLNLCRDFGPDSVGMITGDATVNPGALILCCTAEILANEALRDGRNANIQDVIIDEFHYYSDRDRGVSWQIPLLTLSQSRFLLMSATMGDTLPFERKLTELNQLETVVVYSSQRPVPLDFEYSDAPLHEAVSKLIQSGRSPVYLVNFTQRECAEVAQNFLSIDFCTKDEKKIIADTLIGTRFSSPYGKEIQKLLKHGIGIHHAGLLPKYRILIEKLAQKGLLKIICGTDTLGVGVNVPIRTVLLTKLCKFDGEKTALLSVRDFQQICGRAGRKGYDSQGFVVVQAPEHVIENIRVEQKAAGDPKKLKKIVKRKPPEKGFVPWSKETFQRLVNGQPEALISRFKVSHSMLLHVLSRPQEDGCRAMQKLIRDCHESPKTKKHLGKTAFQLFRSLVDRKIIEFNPLRVNVDLQEDFSLNHALCLYLIDTIRLLDPLHSEYALDVLTLVESIIEDPELILRKQLDRIKTEKMSEMKLEGIEYDQRIEELEKLEYPKPRREFIYDTFNEFARSHPWIGQENIRPKSIAREMYETFQSFSEYIREYQLHRSEGLLLRYLSDVYKTLIQTVPESYKTDEIQLITEYLGTLLKSIDSSLLDEWEKLRNPERSADRLKSELDEFEKLRATQAKNLSEGIFSNLKSFKILLSNEIFRLLRALASKDYEEAVSLLSAHYATEWTVERFEKIFESYYGSEHSRICTHTQARASKNTLIDMEDALHWKIQQILIDPEENNDWTLCLSLDIEASKKLAMPILTLNQIGPL